MWVSVDFSCLEVWFSLDWFWLMRMYINSVDRMMNSYFFIVWMRLWLGSFVMRLLFVVI